MAKLLLVEDDNNLREIYEARLQAEGYTIVCANDGEDALVIAKAEKPDLIISDVMMPKISGFEMLDILRNTEELKNVKVIMLTALGQSDDQRLADRLGADRYMVKSQVTLEDIVKVTHQLLQDEEPVVEPTAAPESAPPPVNDTTPTPEPAEESVTVSTEEPAATTETPATVTPGPAESVIAESPVAAAPETPTAPTSPASAAGEVTAEPAQPAAIAEPPSPPESPETTAPSAPALPQSTTSRDGAISTAQEEADVKTQIEDFVAGAIPGSATPSTDETHISDGEVHVPPQNNAALASTEPVQSTTASSSSDDPTWQSSASNDLLDPLPPTPVVTPTVIPPSLDQTHGTAPDSTNPVASAPATAPTSAGPIAPSTVSDDDTTTHSVPIANKKVIKPLELPPKKDLNTLLAMEEAAEVAKQTPPPADVIVPDETEPPAVPLVEAPTTPPIDQATPAPVSPSVAPEEPSAAPAATAPAIGRVTSTVAQTPANPPDNPVDPNSIAL